MARYRESIVPLSEAISAGSRNRISCRSIRGNLTLAQGELAMSPAATAVDMILLMIWPALTTVAGASPRAVRAATQACTRAWSMSPIRSEPNSGSR